MKKLIALSVIGLFIASASCKKLCGNDKDDGCICPAVYDPVCGSNKKTYNNSCEAECAGIKNYKKGTCEIN